MKVLAETIRTRLVQMEVLPGRPRQNTTRMLDQIAAARAEGIALLVFPELALSGYMLGDEWERPAFLRECVACGEEVVAASEGLVVVFGNVAIDDTRRNEDGRVRKYNALFLAEDGRALSPEGCPQPYAIKALQPNYRAFDDSRHFHCVRRLAWERGLAAEALIAPFATRRAGRVGGMLCEDAWDADYGLAPARILAAKGARLLINASCSPFTRDKNHKRNRVFSTLARETGCTLLYVNAVGVQDIGKTVYAFDGGSCFYDCEGGIVDGIPAFLPGVLTHELPRVPGPFGTVRPLRADDICDVASAILHGTRAMMTRLGVRRVVIGISGGIDSSVVAALYACLLPPEDILLVSMPGPFSSRTTRGLASELAANLGAGYAEIPIEASVSHTRSQFADVVVGGPGGRHTGGLALSDFALENVQARDRGARVLAAAAAAFGGVVTCNANKAEITVGYGTLYGDILGWLANLGDLWKGQVYALGRHLNDAVFARPVIPEGVFTIVPSAELSAAQAVEAGKGDPLIYPYHDMLFRAWVERWQRATPEEILAWYRDGVLEREIGYEGCVGEIFPHAAAFIADVEKWWGLYQGLAVAKRIQAPPVLAISRRAFGFDHREAQLGARYTERYQALRRELLAT